MLIPESDARNRRQFDFASLCSNRTLRCGIIVDSRRLIPLFLCDYLIGFELLATVYLSCTCLTIPYPLIAHIFNPNFSRNSLKNQRSTREVMSISSNTPLATATEAARTGDVPLLHSLVVQAQVLSNTKSYPI